MFEIVTVPLVSPAIVVMSVAFKFVPLTSVIVTLPVYVDAKLPAKAALISAADPDSATA